MKRSAILSVLSWPLIVYLYLPVVVVIFFAFQDAGRLALPWTGPSLRWFQYVLSDQAFQSAMMASLKVGVASAFCATVIGTLSALAFTRYRLIIQRPLEILAMSPIALPGLFVGLSLLTYFGWLGISLSLFTVILAHILYVFPYVLIVMRSRFERFDIAIE